MTMLVLSNKVSASVVAGTNAVGFAPSHAYVRVERAVSQILVVNTSDDIDDGARTSVGCRPLFPSPSPIHRLPRTQISSPCIFGCFRLITIGMSGRRNSCLAEDHMADWCYVLRNGLTEIQQARVNPLWKPVSVGERFGIIGDQNWSAVQNQLCSLLFRFTSVPEDADHGYEENGEGQTIYKIAKASRLYIAPLLFLFGWLIISAAIGHLKSPQGTVRDVIALGVGLILIALEGRGTGNSLSSHHSHHLK